MKIKVYGSSDDLIVVQGAVTEEFNGDSTFLAFSDGTVLHIKYTNAGIWRITPCRRGSSTYEKITEIIDEDDDGYSDVVTLEGDNLKWVARASEVAYEKKGTMRITDYEDDD